MKSNRLTVAATFSVMFLAAACAANKPAPATSEAAPAAAAGKAPAKDQAGRPAPAGSPLAKVTKGMADSDVRRILGEPDSSKSYETGKRWIPGYGAWATDQSRTEYIYKGQGRITLSRNQYTGGLSVIRVDYDPGI